MAQKLNLVIDQGSDFERKFKLSTDSVSSSNFTWIDSTTPYGVTVRQFLISEMSI